MKGKITNNGMLQIERVGKYVPQYCPVESDDGICGHWCPLFSEPYEDTTPGGKMISLSLCHKTLNFSELIDERVIPTEIP